MPLLMRRRPLLRAAAIGGGAYYAGKRREEANQREYNEQARIAQLEAQQTVPAPDMIEQLTRLGKLHEQGVLTDEEFAQQKAKLLGG